MTVREYHERTKHSLASVRSNQHVLDWPNQPLPFKIYRGLEPLALPRERAVPGVAALDAIGAAQPLGVRRPLPDLAALARLLYLSAGITRTRTSPGGQVMHFRAAACTGALYHIDVYLVCGDLPGLAAGVYHFGPQDFALRRLRGGDVRAALVDASGGEPHVAAAPALLVCSSTFWRNAWKYQARTYRHCFWDCGTVLANLLAAAAAAAIPAHVVLGFADAAVNQLLGLDAQREVALAVVALGEGAAPAPAVTRLAPLALETEPLSHHEVDYPLIHAAHAASSLPDGAAASAWRAARLAPPRPPTGVGAPLALRPLATRPTETLDALIPRRGSARRFARAPIAFEALSTMLQVATGPIAMDVAAALAEPFLIVNAVQGMAPGTYALDAAGASLHCLQTGDFRRDAGYLDLGQELAADAAVDVYLLADLDRTLAAYGERGYRAAQMQAAIVGGRLYLAAYALGLGATGLTFFDDDVIAFFSPSAAGRAVMFLLAAGRPARRAGVG